jgi:hypothetical protein
MSGGITIKACDPGKEENTRYCDIPVIKLKLQTIKLNMFAVMKTFVTDISASTGRNDFILDIWFWHGDLYRVSPFQAYRTSTSCLPRDLEFFMFGTSHHAKAIYPI